MKWMTLSNDTTLDYEGRTLGKKKKKSFGSLSKVFSRGRTRRSIAVPYNDAYEGKTL